jgi:hypothetical protein
MVVGVVVAGAVDVLVFEPVLGGEPAPLELLPEEAVVVELGVAEAPD